MDARTDRLLDIMAAGLYRTGVTDRELAAEWGVSPGHVRQMAAACGRMVRKQAKTSEVLGRAIAAIETILALAIHGRAEKAADGLATMPIAPDLKTALRAVEVRLSLQSLVDEFRRAHAPAAPGAPLGAPPAPPIFLIEHSIPERPATCPSPPAPEPPASPAPPPPPASGRTLPGAAPPFGASGPRTGDPATG